MNLEKSLKEINKYNKKTNDGNEQDLIDLYVTFNAQVVIIKKEYADENVSLPQSAYYAKALYDMGVTKKK